MSLSGKKKNRQFSFKFNNYILALGLCYIVLLQTMYVKLFIVLKIR